MKKTATIFTLIAVLLPITVSAEQVITLDDCRKMAVSADKELEQARQKTLMADYDRKTAIANYFPKISATGMYAYNSKNLSLVNSDQSLALTNLGTSVQTQLGNEITSIMTAILSNPDARTEFLGSPVWQTVFGQLSQKDVSKALNDIGTNIDNALHLDIHNVFAGVVSVQQPVFMGGKIIASNKVAALAKELSETEYEGKYQDVEIAAEKSYWQVVSVSFKNKLALTYLDLLKQMEKDAKAAVDEGVAVQSDLLAVRVKLNEAQMLLARTTNGLALSKMLLCTQIGLPVDSDITLADEKTGSVPTVEIVAKRDINTTFAERPETRMLDLATKIYDKKVDIVKSDMLPKVLLTGNYLISNPNLFNGFSNKFDGMFNVGVAVNIPIFHGMEGMQRTKKAKAEATMYRLKYEDACNKVNLQVEQLSRQQTEALERLKMSQTNLDCAEENLRSAMLGFSEGVVNSDVALAAQTAWIKAETEFIDAKIELQLNHSSLLRAQGEYR